MKRMPCRRERSSVGNSENSAATAHYKQISTHIQYAQAFLITEHTNRTHQSSVIATTTHSRHLFNVPTFPDKLQTRTVAKRKPLTIVVTVLAFLLPNEQ